MPQNKNYTISTHTLRGERDIYYGKIEKEYAISTHTLRGERDLAEVPEQYDTTDFNSHAPWGA